MFRTRRLIDARCTRRGGVKAGRAVSITFQNPETSTVAFVDVVESVRHVQRDERGSIERMRVLMQTAAGVVVEHQGQVIERLGDGLVLRFDTARDAVRCVGALHRLANEEGRALPEPERLHLRAGVHCAPVWSDAEGLYGLGVNLTARVAAVGGPGDTVITASARDQLVAGLDVDLHDLGLCYLKHVDEPVRLFRVQAARPLSSGLKQAIAARMKTRPTLAVMPFLLSVGSIPNSAVSAPSVADIVSQQLIGQLSRTPMLHVISGMSTKALRGDLLPKSALYQALGADYLLQGRVRAADADANGGRLEVSFELWRAGSGEPVLTDALGGVALEALSPSSDLLARITQAVSHRILAVEQRLARGMHALPNLASHTLYLSAVDLLHRFSVQDFERARQMLLALNERAPRHPEPLAWLARWHVFRVVQGWTDDSARDSSEALTYSERALDRDPESSLALTMAGSVMAGIRRDPDEANRLYDAALRHNPNEALAWLMKGVAHGFLYQADAALNASELALGLSPFDPVYDFYCSLGASASLAAGELHRAISLANLAIQKNRSHGSSYRTLSIATYLLGDQDTARNAINELLRVEPQASVALFRARAPGNHPRHDDFAEALRQSGLPET